MTSPKVTPPVRLMANIAGRVISPSPGRAVSQRTIGMPSTSPSAAKSGRSSGLEVVRPSHGSSCSRRSTPRSAPTTLATSFNDSTEMSGHSGRSATVPATASGFSSTNSRRRVRAASIASDGDTSKTLSGGACWAIATPFAPAMTAVASTTAAAHLCRCVDAPPDRSSSVLPQTGCGTHDPRSARRAGGGAPTIRNRVVMSRRATPSPLGLRRTGARTPRRGWRRRRCV